MNMLVVLSFLAWWVVLECSAVGEFLVGVKRVWEFAVSAKGPEAIENF